MWGGRIIQKSQGFAVLLFTTVVLASITAFAFLSAESVVTQQRVVLSAHKEQSAFNIAQAGLDYAVSYLTANYATLANGSSTRVNMPGGGYAQLSFAFVGDKDTIEVTSVGYGADSVNNATVKQLVKYNEGLSYKTLSQAAIGRNGLYMGSTTAVISDNQGNTVTTRLGENVISLVNGRTLLNGIISSYGTRIGADIVIDPSIFAGKTTDELEVDFLGRTIAEMADVDTEAVVTNAQATPATALQISATINTASYSVYSKNTLTANSTRNSVTINQVGSSAAISGGTYGSSTTPFVLEVNLSGSSAGSAVGSNRPSYLLIQSNAIIYGDVIVHGGDLVLDKGATIHGDVIANGGTIQVRGSRVNGAVVSSSHTSLFAGTTINGLVYAGGDFRTFSPNTVVNGGVYAGNQLRIGNTPLVYDPGYPNNTVVANAASTTQGGRINYNANLAKIAAPGASGYGRVAGSWTDL